MNEEFTREQLSEILAGMTRSGITRSSAQSKLLMRDYGVRMAPHILAEFKAQERKHDYE